jgi:hypothetical protein
MKKCTLFSLLLAPVFAFTQNVGIGTTIPVARLHVVDSNVIFSAPTIGAFPGGHILPINGAGSRMMWIPRKAAFRAGSVTDASWDYDSIGVWSFAGGANNIAKADFTTAFGYGNNSNADYSTSMGQENIAQGVGSMVWGFGSIARGTYSTAFGSQTIAEGFTAMANGNLTTAVGNESVAMGFDTYAKAQGSLAIGRYNDSITSSSKTAWVATDPAFIIGNGTSDAARHNAMVVYKNSNMILKSAAPISDPPSYITPVSGAGTRMMWLNEKSAFRAGTVDGVQWNNDNIGVYSFAAGLNVTASGNASVAIGFGTTSTGFRSVAIGYSAVSTGFGSVALGLSTQATNSQAFATGWSSQATGITSTAMGDGAIAQGNSSVAIGLSTWALGTASTAIGYNTTARGITSMAMGVDSRASGDNATSLGLNTVARSYGSIALGTFNDSIASSFQTGWDANDPLLIVGNGQSDALRSNAMVIYKNGNTDLSGFTQLGSSSAGAPSIKMKKLTGVSPAIQGGLTNIPHGLTRSKIIGVQVLLTYAAGVADIPGSYLDVPAYEYNWQVNNTDVQIYTKTGNSANILNKAVRVLITYEE